MEIKIESTYYPELDDLKVFYFIPTFTLTWKGKIRNSVVYLESTWLKWLIRIEL